MSDLNMQLVREFFELNRFYVLPHWRCEDVSHSSENTSLLFVERAHTEAGVEPEFLLRPADLSGIRRAVVEAFRIVAPHALVPRRQHAGVVLLGREHFIPGLQSGQKPG